MNRSFALSIGFLVCSLFILLLSPSPAPAAEPLTVHVDNWPETHHVRGSVAVDGPVSHIKFARKEAIVVPPSRRAEPSEMAHAGVIESDGFTTVTLSLQGEVKGSSPGTGAVGALLVPDEGPIIRAFREARRLQFAIEVVSNLKSGDPVFFHADQVQQRLTFPRYKIYLYNTMDRTVEANLYLALTN